MAIFDDVKEVVVEQLNVSPDEVTLEANFVEDLGADSLDVVELVMALEEKFEIEIPDSDAEGIQSVKDVVDYIEKAKNGVCKICGITPLKDGEICKFCLKFKELGEKLPKAKYINFNLDDLLSIKLDTKPNKDISLSFDSYPLKRVANYVPKFSEGEIKKSKYELLDDKNEAVSERGIKTFYHIAVDGLKEDGDKFYGRKYLAILKADIDNLGQIFINGFKKLSNFVFSTFSTCQLFKSSRTTKVDSIVDK